MIFTCFDNAWNTRIHNSFSLRHGLVTMYMSAWLMIARILGIDSERCLSSYSSSETERLNTAMSQVMQ